MHPPKVLTQTGVVATKVVGHQLYSAMANLIATPTKVSYVRGVPLRRYTELTEEASALLAHARALLGGPPGGGCAQGGDEEGILALYEALRQRLAAVDSAQVEQLLARLSRVIEDLGELKRQLVRLRRLRSSLDQV